MKILVTDGNNRASLAITRSLAMQGHSIVIGATSHPSLASSSKFCSSHIIYPDPVQKSDDFIRLLEKVTTELNIDMLIPVSDVTTLLLAQNYERHFTHCKLPIPSLKSLNRAADKKYITDLAHSIGIPAPETLSLESKRDISLIPKDISIPVVIKPARSRVQIGAQWISTSVSYANNYSDLIDILNKKNNAEFPILLQERINGPGVGIFMCYYNNKVYALFSHKRLREKPPSGGVSVLRESVVANTKAVELSEKILNHLNWQGVAMLEYKVDLRDNSLKIMEINGRFWGSLQLAIDAGIDFPAILVDLANNKPVEPKRTYKIGVRSRWLCGDIDSLLSLLLKRRSNLNLPMNHIGRVRTLLSFLKFWEKDLKYEVLRLSDIKPWLYELKEWLRI